MTYVIQVMSDSWKLFGHQVDALPGQTPLDIAKQYANKYDGSSADEIRVYEKDQLHRGPVARMSRTSVESAWFVP